MPAAIGAGVAYGAVALGWVKAGSLAFSAVSFGATAGSTFLFSLLRDQDDDDDQVKRTSRPNPGSSDASIRQGHQPQRFILGAPVTTGVIVDQNVSAVGGVLAAGLTDADNSGMYKVEQIMFANHQCGDIEQIWIGDTPVLLAGTDLQAPRFLDPDTNETYVHFHMNYGTRTQGLDPIWQRNFPAASPFKRYVGHTYATVEKYWGENRERHSAVWNQGEDLRLKLRGAAVYDPRDSRQHIDAPDSWRWSDNAALCTAWLLANPKFIKGAPYERQDLEMLRRAADSCDKGAYTWDGRIEKRYTINGVVDTEETQSTVIRQMLEAMAGTLTYDGYKYGLKAGEAEAPAGVITEADIVGPVNHARGVPASDNYTRAIISAHVAEAGWQNVQVPLIEEGTADEPQNELSRRLRFVYGNSRAQRLGRILLRGTRAHDRLDAVVSGAALKYRAGNKIIFDLPSLGVQGLYSIRSNVSAEDFPGACTIDAIGWDNAAFTIRQSDLTQYKETIA